jgi:3-deoxy-D-manno-octulosonate 8-phosphate phosphatase (KDO 8-P phosphatase)
MSNFKEDLMNIKAFAFDVDGVLSQTYVPMFPNGEPMRTANIKDGYALQLAIKKGYRIAIITGGKTEAIEARFKSLGITDIFMGTSDKLPVFNQWIEKHGLRADQVMYMGDDIPDLPVMRVAGLAVAPADAAQEVKAVSKYISDRKGGEGCVRDVVEQVLRVHNDWDGGHTW